MWIKIDQLKLDACTAPVPPEKALHNVLRKTLGIPVKNFVIAGKSVDARRGRPQILYRILAEVENPPLGMQAVPPPPDPDETALWQALEPKMQNPIVVGTGPCGIFAALGLALAGCKPVILDRGQDVERRTADYKNFLSSRLLDPESNLLIGEGGAGTFSDGKLYTNNRDKRIAFILDTLVRHGAPPEIRYLKRPHIGSDNLTLIARNLRKYLQKLGAEFHFGVQVTGLQIQNNICTGVRTSSGEVLSAPCVVLAAGLGGRELTQNLCRQQVPFVLKPFQIGCRIEHPQKWVDRQQYRMPERPAALAAAEYHLSSPPKDGILGVSSFCMCPGGEVLAASAWPGQLVSNGMSEFARAGMFANAALIATLDQSLFHSPEDAYCFLADLEKKAFALGGGDYTFPAQSAAAFLRQENGLTRKHSSVAIGITPGRLDLLLPAPIRDALGNALKDFDRKCPGFIREGMFLGLESCISSPVRFLRDPATGASPVQGLYCGGEFGGWAGGITSAAADGLRIAWAICGGNPEKDLTKPPSGC
ncbi:MAG: FAD-dependent oxidoreductase [Lentisphaeria bacterium]|nr:FAD-dependent oxidoreductase [Lentisphaeria bacterium]